MEEEYFTLHRLVDSQQEKPFPRYYDSNDRQNSNLVSMPLLDLPARGVQFWNFDH